MTAVDEQATSKSEVPSLAACSVCNGTTGVTVGRPPPLPVCLRCRGRGYVVPRSKRLEYPDEIETLERARREKEAAREPDGFLERLKRAASRTEEEREIERIEDRMDRDRQVAGEDDRILRVRNCPSCEGIGVGAGAGEVTVTEYQRCDGVGRMVTRSFRSVTNALGMSVVDGGEVCDGDGELAVDVDPPLVECRRCDGFDRTDEYRSHDGPTIQETCDRCDGRGSTPRGTCPGTSSPAGSDTRRDI